MSTLELGLTRSQLAHRMPCAPVERVKPARQAGGKPLRPRVARGGPRVTERRPDLAAPGKIGLLTTPSPEQIQYGAVPEIKEVVVEPVKVARVRLTARERGAIDDPMLRPVDFLLDQWTCTAMDAVGEAGGTPKEPRCTLGDRASRRRSPPLDYDTADLVTDVVLESPEPIRRFVKLWYWFEMPVTEIMDAMRIKGKDKVYDRRREVLWYLRGAFDRVLVLPVVAWS